MTTPHLIHDMAADYADYLRDESRRVGQAEGISFPTSEADIRSALAEAHPRHWSITLQGARTGITAGAVPNSGLILNLSRMQKILGLRRAPNGDFILQVEPGLTLTELRRQVADRSFDTLFWSQDSLQALEDFRSASPFFFPPDPTEASASIGGMVACNASGACSYRYGPTRRFIEGLDLVLADGDQLRLRRGEHRAVGRTFSVQTESGRILRGQVPGYTLPAVKNASGFHAEDDMDLVDLFIGAEGTLGILSSIELRLIPAPAAVWGITAFFPALDPALEFVDRLRTTPLTAPPAAIEFFDAHALNLLRGQKTSNPAFSGIPDMPAAFHTAIYVEFQGPTDDAISEAVMVLSDLMGACGGSEEATWIATDSRELERFKKFRHAVPEAVNLLIDQRRKTEPGLTKLGTDMSVPDSDLKDILSLYTRTLAETALEYVIFGHIGNNHVHVNIIPKDMAEYDKGKALYLTWAREVIRRGGSVSAEHGIGKLKIALLREMYGEEGIAAMRAVKTLFDPDGLLNRGNLF
jgi:D-lactate dehydrogenase (cytochrome)